MTRKNVFARSFGRGSPVLAYWLERCEGFALVSPSGRRTAIVESVVLTESGGRVLIVRTSILNRRRLIDAARVGTVVPETERLVLAAGTRRDSRPRRRQAAVATTSAAARFLAAGARTTVAALVPPLRLLLRVGVRVATKAALAAAAGGRRCAHRARHQGLIAAARTVRACRSALVWMRPRAAALLRLTAAVLVAVSLLLFALLRRVALAAGRYGRTLPRSGHRVRRPVAGKALRNIGSNR